MTSLVFGALSRYGISLVEFGLTWWLQSAILLLAGLLAAVWCRRRGAAMQSMIYRVTLVAVLVCPLVTQVLSISGVSLLNIDLQSRLVPISAAQDPSAIEPDTAEEVAVAEESLRSFDQTELDFAGTNYPTDVELTKSMENYDKITQADAFAVSPHDVDHEVAGIPGAPTTNSSDSIDWALAAAKSLLVVWCIGAFCFSACLLVDVVRAEMLRRKSVDGDELANQVCRRIASQLHVRSPKVLSNPFLNSPCLLGHWRPAVLLPEETPATTYHEVFLHELAHLRRGDWVWSVLGRAAGALLWCQPLLWLMLRRNSMAAEEVCDDYVLQFGGNREEYLRQLIEISERTLPRPRLAGVAMVSFQSKLGQRARRILDTTRVLSTSAGRWFAGVALVATLVATISVGMIYVGKPRASHAQDVATSTLYSATDMDEANQIDSAASTNTEDQDWIIPVKGRVVDANGNQIGGATVRVSSDDGAEVPKEVTTGAKGEFEIAFDKSQFRKPNWHAEPWRRGMVYVTAPGFGTSWVTGDELSRNATPELRLVKDDVPVVGRVLDLEGQPVAGASVTIWSIAAPDAGDLADIWQDIEKHPTLAESFVGGRMRNLSSTLAGLVAQRGSMFSTGDLLYKYDAIRTDETASFELRGVGRGRIVRARVEGPSIQSSTILIVTTASIDEHWPPQELTDSTRSMLDSGGSMPQIYAAKFEHVAKPSRPISGVVRDSKTGEPIAGIGVAGDVRGAGDHAYTKTDENGRYTLTGLATEGRLRLYAVSRQGIDAAALPYIGVEREWIDFSTSSPPKDTDFNLARGVLVHGNLKDDAGRPVKARVEYLGHGTNEFLQKMEDKPSPYESVITDDSGDFQLVVPPGPGAMAVSAGLSRDATTHYAKAEPDDFGLPVGERGFIATTNRGLIQPEDYEAARFIDFSADDKPVIELEVTRLVDLARVRFVDEAGQRVESVQIAARLPRSDSFGPFGYGTPTVEILELHKKGRRPVVVRSSDDRLATPIFAADDPRTPHLSEFAKDDQGIYSVTLRPAASISGRLVDADGSPVTKAKVMVLLSSQPTEAKRPVEFPETDVDNNGGFLVKGLPATGPFMLGVDCEEGRGIVKINIELVPGREFDAGKLDVTQAVDPRAFLEATSAAEPQAETRSTVSAPQGTISTTSETKGISQIDGRVIAPNGQAVPGARVFVVAVKPELGAPPQRAITARTASDDDGRFSIPVQAHTGLDDSRGHGSTNIVATKDGFGFGWELIQPNSDEKEVLIRLAEPKQITGRLVDLEGQPLAGVRISVAEISAPKPGVDLDQWHAKAMKNPAKVDENYFFRAGTQKQEFIRFPTEKSLSFGPLAEVPTVVTDNDGTFALGGIGRDDLVTLSIEGGGAAKALISVVARDMAAVNMPNFDARFGTQKLYGAKFDYAAPLSRLVRGVVVDKETRKPLSDVYVEVSQFGGSTLNVSGTIQTHTDELGRFELTGLPARKGHFLTIKPEKQPYFQRRLKVPDATGLAPVEMTIELQRGRWIHGRLTDGETGEPIAKGWVSYYPFLSNKNAEKIENFDAGMTTVGYSDRKPINNDGSYQVLGVLGRGIVLAGASNAAIYKTGSGADEIKDLYAQREAGNPRSIRPAVYHIMGMHMGNAVQDVNIIDGKQAQCDLVLERYERQRFAVADDQGRPVTDFRATGHLPGDPISRNPLLWQGPKRTDPYFEVLGLDNGIPRTVSLRHDEKKIGLVTTITNDKQPQKLQLQPLGVIIGKAVDAEGKPAAAAAAHLYVATKRKSWNYLGPSVMAMGEDKTESDSMYLGTTSLGENGEFQFDAVPPGTKYTLSIYGDQGEILKQETPTVTPGARVDLGDLKADAETPELPSDFQASSAGLQSLASNEKKSAEKDDLQVKEADATAASTDLKTAQINGPEPTRKSNRSEESRADVVDAGQVVTSDKVTVLQGRIVTDGSDELPEDLKLFKASVHLGNETSRIVLVPRPSIRQDGAFSVEMTNLPSQIAHELPTDQWVDGGLFATAKGFGIAWLYSQDGLAETKPIRLRLVSDDVPIRGRVLDSEGRAVAGVKAIVGYIYAAPEETLAGFLAGLNSGTVLEQLRSKLTRSFNCVDSAPSLEELGISSDVTDRDGNFSISGIGRERLAMIYVQGKGIQRQRFFVATRDMAKIVTQPRGQANAETVYGVNCTLVASPGLTIEGVVHDADTRQPLADVLIRDSTLNNVSGAHTPSFKATTDRHGRYRIDGFPTTGYNRLIAVPNDEQPYFIRDAVVQAPSDPGKAAVTLDFDLHRGIWIKGRITDQKSGKPVKAALRYLPFLSNEYARDIPEINGANPTMHSSRLQHRYQSNTDGTFCLVGLPGRAIVGVDAYGTFLTGTGADRIEGIDEDGEFATYDNPVKASLNLHGLIEINPSEEENEVIVNFELQRGVQEPIHVVDEKGTPVLGTHVTGLNPRANYLPEKHWLPTMQVVGLGPHERRKVLIQHRGRNLAATAEVVVDEIDEPQKVQLRKAASIQGQLVNASGDPIDGVTIEAWTTLIRNGVQLAKATTDQSGHFSMDSIPGPNDYSLRLVRFDGRLPEDARQLRIESGQSLTLGTLKVQ